MTKGQRAAYRLRWMILIAGLLCLGGSVWWLCGGGAGLWGTPAAPGDFGDDGPYWAALTVYLGVFFLTQWLFLCPRGNLRVRTTRIGRPMPLSIVIAALWAMMLSTALLATLLELPGWWEPMLDGLGSWQPVWAAMAVMWAVWTLVFYRYWRGRGQDHYTQTGRMLRGLIAGSVLELLVAAPAHALALGREDKAADCYCARGSYTGLVFGGTVLLWAFGPGVALLFLRERHRRRAAMRNVSGDDSL